MKLKTWHGCTANWNNSSKDTPWWIINGADQNELARLPSSLSEHEVMVIVHTVRDLETASYSEGKKLGGNAMLAANRQKMIEQQAHIDGLSHSNSMLANKLESLIGAQE